MNKQLTVIVQAGGRGSRLRHHTWNKPKCLVSVYGKPLLYHLFDQFNGARFIIIGDYAFDNLQAFLTINPPSVPYSTILTTHKGTLSGIREVINTINSDDPVLIIWSDLFIQGTLTIPSEAKQPVIYTTSDFVCRWSISEENRLHERPSRENGIPGIFYFPNTSVLSDLPESGEFVKWFAANIDEHETLQTHGLEELGDFNTIEQHNTRDGFCRYFNEIKITPTTIIKSAKEQSFEKQQQREIQWYKDAAKLGFKKIPTVLNENPFTLERIKGKHIDQIGTITPSIYTEILKDLLDSLTILHNKKSIHANKNDALTVYLTKTIERIDSVSSIIPGFNRESITINGKKCRNFLHKKHSHIFKSTIEQILPEEFVPIHGDPTFSNTLVDENWRVWFFDPRGYFASDGIMGDKWYDFAKVYYSAIGGYDTFNRRKFKLYLDEQTVEILLEEPKHSNIAANIFCEHFPKDLFRIKVLHGLIWLSLSGFARDDLDSIIGAFYLGLYWLEDGITNS